MGATLKVDASTVLPVILSKIPTKGDVKKIKQALGAAARDEWISMAQDELHSTSRDYISKGLQEAPEITDRGVSVHLVGTLPNMVEQGWPPHDLRTTVLKSAKAKTSKEGHKYLAIPFRHGSTGAIDKVNVGKKMPKAIHMVARHLTSHLKHGEFVLKGERLHGGSKKMGKKAAQIMKRPERTWHSASIYLGMIRKAEMQKKKGGEAKEQTTGYSTFRTISENVIRGKTDKKTGAALQHWHHPGIKARNLAPKVQKHIRGIAMGIVRDAIK